MPTVRRGERTVDTTGLPRARFGATRSAESEGAFTEQAKGRAAAAEALKSTPRYQGIAAIGGEAERMGAAIFRDLQEKERKAAHETAMLKASNGFSDWKNQYLYDPNTGALNKKGEAALPLPEEAKEQFEKLANELEKGMSTDEQRAAFQRLRGNEWQALDLQVRRHTFGEMQQYRQTELENHINNSSNAAVQSYADPKMVGLELNKAVTAIRTSGPSLGLGQEAIDAKVDAVQSKVHVGVINNLLADEKSAEAQAYYEATSGQINGELQDGVKKALEEGSVRASAQKHADQIEKEGGTLAQQLEKAKGLPPKEREHVEQRLEHRAILREKAKRDAEEDVMREAYDTIDSTGDVANIDPATWSSFNGSTRSAMIAYSKQKAAGNEPETDWAQYYRLTDTAAQSPNDFARVNLLNYRPYLSDTEYKQLVGLQSSIKSGNREAAEKVQNPLLTHKQLIDNTLVEFGIDPDAKYDTPEGQAIAQLRRNLQQRVNLLQGGGKEARTEDVQAELDAIISASHTTKGSWWNIFPGGKPFRDTTKRYIDYTISDVPAGDRKDIETALRANNEEVNDQAILRWYIDYQLRQSTSRRGK